MSHSDPPIEHVEGVAHIGEEVVGGGKAAVLVEAIVIGFVGIWNDEMRPAADVQPIGQFVGERIAVVEKAALLDHKPPRIGTGPSRHPAGRPRSGQPGQNIDGAGDVLPFDMLRHRAVIDPAIAVADDFMAARSAGFRQIGILLERAGDAEDAHLDVELGKNIEHAARRRGGCRIRKPIRPAVRVRRAAPARRCR